jgi:hypothetical protein
MDTRQLLGLLLVIGGALWLVALGRRSKEERTSFSEAGTSPQPRVRRLKAVAAGLPNRSLLAVILLILGALLLVPWNNVFGSSDSTAPCCPPGALSGSAIVMVIPSRSQLQRGWRSSGREHSAKVSSPIEDEHTAE